jgi:hypothetical protein
MATTSTPTTDWRTGANTAGVSFRERFVHDRANLQFLDCGAYEIPAGGCSSWFGIADANASCLCGKARRKSK